ncbi:MAG TPA: DUF2147 domain-containing protein [Flavobacteriales bacterium]|nr:DUF2147 domain-containing protein [Flavobacteriales bacterium]HQW87912.1 DUF2147 domain-containing protein [Flavobacteriales bacterium]
MRALLLSALLAATLPLAAQPPRPGNDITGRWTTIDDNTGKPRSVVEITVRNGKAYGRIVDLHDKTKLEKVCDLCPGDRKDQRILGLEVIRDMVADGDEWDDGTILDPENGKEYSCKLWVEDGTLKVRGYIAFLYRTQTWVRATGR